jgi:isopenicillin-N N-acyltransferase-like protein
MPLSRREFLQRSALASAAAFAASPGILLANESTGEIRPATLIAGSPRGRGKKYGSLFKDDIAAFLDREIYQAFIEKPSPKDRLLKYAGACAEVIRKDTPEIYDELAGMAEGSGLKLEEHVLLTAHEELYHRGEIPLVEHCTAVAAGPNVTSGDTYVGQTWDWMQSVFGLSQMLHWQRTEGPSLLAYSFPGLWVGAGLNSAGLALCWTSADLGKPGQKIAVGLPAYVILAHLMYQESLAAVEEEARRVKNAGWFTFVMADGEGNLLNVEGSPDGIVLEKSRGQMVRIGFGSREMIKTPIGQDVPRHARCEKMSTLLSDAEGKVDLAAMQEFFASPTCGINVGKSTIDMMVFDTTNRTAYLSRGPSYAADWREFTFPEEPRTK